MINKRFFLFWVFLITSFLSYNKAAASIEPFENFIKGNLKVGDSLWVKDEKFRNPSFNWASLNHLSVKNYVSLKIIDNTPIAKDFNVKFRLKVAYYMSPNQVNPNVIDTVSLNVNYKKGVGATYNLSDVYEFNGAHEIKVYIEEISSPQYGSQLPVSMQLTSGIVVDRLYPFEPYTPISFSGIFNSVPPAGNGQMLLRGSLENKVQLNVIIPVVVGADEYDLEWTPIDKPSEYSEAIEEHTITPEQLAELFKNNATRVTLKNQQQYAISLIYNCEWIAVRVRSVRYNAEGVRVESVWSYEDSQNGGLAIWDKINWHESKLNWKYEATYAEEGKKKEVISYFDGSLRNRQTVTLLNQDVNVNNPVPVVQESVYDEFGRPVANILPAPIKEAGITTAYLKYFKGLNKNAEGKSYNFEDLKLDDCVPLPNPLNAATQPLVGYNGAAGYYSSNNSFLTQNEFNKYLPNAEGFPLSVNLYTLDNTGRLAKQGGVGPTFQPGTSTTDHTTRYFYGRPEQWELDAVFGNDVGYASRYQKNMVIDPNGQASITYLNAAGKTIATALTGDSPGNLAALNSAANVKDQTINLLRPDDFKFEISALKLVATTTYISSVIPSGSTILKYNISQLISRYPNAFDPCSNCFYRLKISVKNDCGEEKYEPSSSNGEIIIGSKLSNPQLTEPATGNIELNLDKIGTYFVTIELALDETAIRDYTEQFVQQGSNGFLYQRERFVSIELKKLESYFLTCFTGCDALTKLGSLEDFRTMFKQKLVELGEGPFQANNSLYDFFIEGAPGSPGLYEKIYDEALKQQNACKTPALGACDSKRALMLEDVSPNGQYAMFDQNGNALETETNILHLHYRAVFSGTPNPDDDIILENGDKISPYDLNFSLAHLVKYWKPAWAKKFIEFHPEFCKLQFCEDNYASENWDSQLKKQQKAPTATDALTGNVVFNQNLTAANWLVAHDPFFKTGGLGNSYASLMSLDLNEYSFKVLKRDPNVPIGTVYPLLKNLLQINLIQLYCSVDGSTTNSSTNQDVWNNCTPKSDCREFDREWQLYRDGYLELKQKYIDLARKANRCANACEVGKPEEVKIAPEPCGQVLTLNSTGQQILANQFVEVDAQGYQYTYHLVAGNINDIPVVSDYCGALTAPVPEFYPCITVKYPGNTNGIDFRNVWKVTCVADPVSCGSYGEIFASQDAGPNIFYVNLGGGTREVHYIYEGYSPSYPPTMYCNGNSVLGNFYDCFKVNVYGYVYEFSNVYVAVCYENIFNPPFGGRMANAETASLDTNTTNAIAVKDKFSDVLASYLSPSRQVLADTIAKSLLIDTVSSARTYSNYVNQNIYSILSAGVNSLTENVPATRNNFNPYVFKEHFTINTNPKAFVKLKNVWVAELLPDSGSVKYKEQQIINNIIAGAASKKSNALAQKSIAPAAIQTLSTGGACVSVSDDLWDYFYYTCQGVNTPGSVIKRTTAVLLDGNGQPTTLANDVVVKVQYQEMPRPIGGTVFPLVTLDIVIPAGQSSAYYEYTESQWVYWPGETYCIEERFLYQCVTEVVGAGFCQGQVNCDGVPGTASCHARLSDKISRFPVSAQQNVEAVNTDTYKAKNEEEIKKVVEDAAEGHADSWMQALAPAIQITPVNETLLRSKLKELAALAVAPQLRDSKNNPLFMNGVSSVPQPLKVMVNGTPCTSYGEILKVIFGKTAYTNDINPWLLEGPVPYPTVVNGKFVNKMQVVPVTISHTNQEIVDKLESLKPYPNITAAAFYTYLQTTFGNTMTLTLEELEALMKACGECKFILGKDITLPVFLEPGAKGFITKAEYDQALIDMNASFQTSPDDSWNNYETIVANFLNHNFGFALSYNQYKQFADENPNNPAAKLSNQPPYIQTEGDRYECAKSIIATAFYTADPLYQAYLAEEKRKFREAYIATCSAARASFNLETKQNIYHYTLYYYDQTGNLIRTVPPAGVSVLSNAEQIQVQKFREFSDVTCNYEGPTTPSVTNTALQQLSNTLGASGNHALEFWLYKTNGGNRQLLASTPDNKYIFQMCIAGQQLSVDIFTINQQNPNSITFTNSSHITAQIGSFGALPWLHVVLQGNSLATTGALQLWVNGQQQTVEVNGASAGCGWQVGGNPIQLPQNQTALKHLRHYDRLMEAGEILVNSQNSCLMPLRQSLAWDRFNVPNAGDPTTTGSNSTAETQYRVPIYPDHGLQTNYAYNSTNQVVEQNTPDAGKSTFWYDYLSRMTISQNAKQAIQSNYSYTQYDALGRIIEVGQKNTSHQLVAPGFLTDTQIADFAITGTNDDVTHTIYDELPKANNNPFGVIRNLVQQNLRKRVAVSLYQANSTTPISASYYSYDLAGNVKMLYQQIAGLYNENEAGSLKHLEYEYDLVSGKVNFLAYQHGYNDAFYYKYDYDAENRLINAWSSISAIRDAKGFGSSIVGSNQRLDASYRYYLHGPLARTELGDQGRKVQGLDYAYTLQGWLKGVNGTSGQTARDMGLDGHNGSNNATVAKDAFGFALHYYGFEDYKPIVTAVKPFSDAQSASAGFAKLYNGNIGGISLDNYTLGIPQLYTYKYDQLNRLVKTFTYNGLNLSTNTWNVSGNANQRYREEFAYDANGNLTTLSRNGDNLNALLMDKFTYGYNKVGSKLQNNRLRHIKDTAPAASYTTDIDNQIDDNYTYDAIGNLTGDTQEGINKIEWNVYGKIRQIEKTSGNINYAYDASGKRVSKLSNGKTTYYIRDAQGNTLAVYDKEGANGLYWREQYLYGSSRLGLWQPNLPVSTPGSAIWGITGNKRYELSNHLGNVLAVISDSQSPSTSGNLEADIISATDYYAFGSPMPGRSVNFGNYRYGFNGKENDNEVKKDANGNDIMGAQQDYGARIYDNRIGKWLSVDPLQSKYPSVSPYVFAMNNPLYYIDIDGRDVLPSPAFLASKYGVIYNLLKGSSPTFNNFLKPYLQGKMLNLVLDINPAKIPPPYFAYTVGATPHWLIYQSSGKVVPNSFSWKTPTTEYYSNEKLVSSQTWESNGKTFERSTNYNEFFIAATIIHETIHAYIDADKNAALSNKRGDPDHSKLNNYHELFVKSLTEYVEKRGLNYTSEDIEDMSWNGTEKSKQFKAHFDELSRKNGTSAETEISSWRQRVGKIARDYGTPQEKSNVEPDSTKKNDKP